MNKPLILVVEDDTPVRNLITMTLKTHEYRYLSAQNGASAVMEALSHNPDIVLLDLGLPDMDGVEVIQKIRSWSNMPIIVISARTEDSDKIGGALAKYVRRYDYVVAKDGSGDFFTVQEAVNAAVGGVAGSLNSLCTGLHCTTHAGLHCSTERNTVLKL